MGAVVSIAVLAVLGFIGWFIYRAFRDKSVRAHTVSYGIAIVAGIFTYAYFLSLDLPKLIKIVASILLGIVLIVAGALYQRRIAGRPPKSSGQ
ncbi:MAG: hypothetical protein A2137_04505 [Chloroflexi bacterium RBG_16_58_8]|nr:MAG: hypothetical protein A2137_04505 [Chloroflexi bacterium RBG_16_58_8]